MSQKSLPTLNKVNTSMIWYVTLFYKHYRWLSSQYIYFLYFLNKLFIYLDFFFSKFVWNVTLKNYFYSYLQKPLITKYKKIRFFYPVTAYLVRLPRCNIFFNVFYKTTLDKFQMLTNREPEIIPRQFKEIDYFKLKLLYYR